MKKLLIIFALLSSCSELISPTEKLGNTVNLKIDDSVKFENGLTIKYVFPSESRCPQNVQCIRWGELGASFSIAYNGETKDVTYCVDGECLGNENNYTKFLLSGSKVNVGGKDFAITIVDFTPKVAEVGVIGGSKYSVSIKVSE